MSIPSSTISEVNKQVREVRQKEKKRRGEYLKVSPVDKLSIAKYASENGVSATVRRFKDKNLKESSVRDWKKAYEKELKEKTKCALFGEEVVIRELPLKKRGRPPLLGEKVDKLLQEMIVSMRSRGTPIATSVVVGVGRGLLLNLSSIKVPWKSLVAL